MVLFRQNLPQLTQAQLMEGGGGEVPETLCIEQGVVLSCGKLAKACRVEGSMDFLSAPEGKCQIRLAEKARAPVRGANNFLIIILKQ